MLEKLKKITSSSRFQRLSLLWAAFWLTFALGVVFSHAVGFIFGGLVAYSTIELLAILKLRRTEQQLHCLLREAGITTEACVVVVEAAERLCAHEDEPE